MNCLKGCVTLLVLAVWTITASAEESATPLVTALRRTTISGYVATVDCWNTGVPAAPLTEVLLQNEDGRLAHWIFNGTTLVRATNLPAITAGGSDLKALAFGADWIFFQNEKELSFARMLNGRITDLTPIRYSSRLAIESLHFGGVANVYGDNNFEIIWNTGPQLVIWQVRDGTVISEKIRSQQIFPLLSDAEIVTVADLSGNGIASILWGDSRGNARTVTATINPNGTVFHNSTSFRIPAGLQVRGTGDFNQDGSPDLLCEDNERRQIVLFRSEGEYIPGQVLRNGKQLVPGWKIVSSHPISLFGGSILALPIDPYIKPWLRFPHMGVRAIPTRTIRVIPAVRIDQGRPLPAITNRTQIPIPVPVITNRTQTPTPLPLSTNRTRIPVLPISLLAP